MLGQRLFPRSIKISPGLIGIVALMYTAWLTRTVLLLIFWGCLLALLLQTASAFLQRKLRVNNLVGILLVVVSFLLLVAASIWMVGPAVANQFTLLSERFPESLSNVLAKVEAQPWMRWLAARQIGVNDLLPNLRGLLLQASGAISSVVAFFIAMTVICFIGVYVSVEPATYIHGLLYVIPQKKKERVERSLHNIARALRFWLLARLVSMASVGVLVTLGLALLRVPSALGLGIIAALLTFVPNIGPILSALPATILAFSLGPRQCLYVILLFCAVHAIEGTLLTPLAERQTVKLAPALTFSVQVVLAVLVGPLGLALAAPLTVTALVLIRDSIEHHKSQAGARDAKGREGISASVPIAV